MGAKSYTQVADKIDTDTKTTKNSNFGESLGGGVNGLEILTFILVTLAALYFLKVFCEKRRKRRLQEMQQHLQGVAIQEYPLGPAPPVVQPVAARVPIVAAPPPVYPGDALASASRQMMQKYK